MPVIIPIEVAGDHDRVQGALRALRGRFAPGLCLIWSPPRWQAGGDELIDETASSRGKLTGGGEIGEADFGFVVALSSDGNTALIGGPSDKPPTPARELYQRLTTP